MPTRTDLNPAFRPIGGPNHSPGGPSPATPQVPQLPVDQLISKALDGSISGPEAEQLSQLLKSNEHKDAFTAEQRKDLQKFTQGKELPPRPASELHGDLSLVKDVRDLPERLAADLALVRQELLEHATLLRADKATRMFDFAVPYVKALVAMAATPAEQKAVSQQMLLQAEKAGYRELDSQPDGKNALKVLRDLLKAKSPDEVDRLANGLKFDAPIWPKDPIRQSDPRHAAEREPLQVAAQKAGEPQLLRPMPQVMVPPVPVQQQRVTDPEASREQHDGTNKKLGRFMLWNALHTLRDAGENEQDSAAQREAMTQLAVAAGLFIALFAIIIGVLVAL